MGTYKFQRNFSEISEKFQGNYREISGKLQRNFTDSINYDNIDTHIDPNPGSELRVNFRNFREITEKFPRNFHNFRCLGLGCICI